MVGKRLFSRGGVLKPKTPPLHPPMMWNIGDILVNYFLSHRRMPVVKKELHSINKLMIN